MNINYIEMINHDLQKLSEVHFSIYTHPVEGTSVARYFSFRDSGFDQADSYLLPSTSLKVRTRT